MVRAGARALRVGSGTGLAWAGLRVDALFRHHDALIESLPQATGPELGYLDAELANGHTETRSAECMGR